MPWIKQISVDEATGLLKTQFEAAVKRAGRVWNSVHSMSLNPEAMQASIAFYRVVMFGERPLTRVQPGGGAGDIHSTLGGTIGRGLCSSRD